VPARNLMYQSIRQTIGTKVKSDGTGTRKAAATVTDRKKGPHEGTDDGGRSHQIRSLARPHRRKIDVIYPLDVGTGPVLERHMPAPRETRR
jgi:hypothetical protein